MQKLNSKNPVLPNGGTMPVVVNSTPTLGGMFISSAVNNVTFLHSGTLFGGEEIKPGVLHGGEAIEPGVLHGGEEIKPGVLHGVRSRTLVQGNARLFSSLRYIDLARLANPKVDNEVLQAP